ncbi:hypothetical protein, partial [Mycolicibacter minnesotensis]
RFRRRGRQRPLSGPSPANHQITYGARDTSTAERLEFSWVEINFNVADYYGRMVASTRYGTVCRYPSLRSEYALPPALLLRHRPHGPGTMNPFLVLITLILAYVLLKQWTDQPAPTKPIPPADCSVTKADIDCASEDQRVGSNWHTRAIPWLIFFGCASVFGLEVSIAVVTAVYAVKFGGRVARERRAKREQLIADATKQHNQVISGDNAGIYGNYPPQHHPGVTWPQPIHPRTPDALPSTPSTDQRTLAPEDPANSHSLSTVVLTADFVAEEFRYLSATGDERRAAFPSKEFAPGLKDTTVPGLNDLASLLASARGWVKSGGADEWWRITFDEHMIETDSADIPNTITFELTDHNPRIDFHSHLALRGEDPILWIYGRSGKDQEEESLSHVSNAMVGLRMMWESIASCVRAGQAHGFVADMNSWLVRVVYRKGGENEFDFRSPCRFQKPKAWEPNWE